MTGILLIRRENVERNRGNGHEKMEIWIRVTLLQTKKHLGPLGAGRGKEGFSPRAFRGSMALLTPRFKPISLWYFAWQP